MSSAVQETSSHGAWSAASLGRCRVPGACTRLRGPCALLPSRILRQLHEPRIEADTLVCWYTQSCRPTEEEEASTQMPIYGANSSDSNAVLDRLRHPVSTTWTMVWNSFPAGPLTPQICQALQKKGCVEERSGRLRFPILTPIKPGWQVHVPQRSFDDSYLGTALRSSHLMLLFTCTLQFFVTSTTDRYDA